MNTISQTVLKDEIGNPIRVYRGEHGPETDSLCTKLASYSFCNSTDTASVYALHPNRRDDVVVSPRLLFGYVQISKPVFASPDDPFIDISDLIEKFGLDEAVKYALRFSEYIEHTNNWEDTIDMVYEDINTVQDLVDRRPELISSLYLYAFPLLDDPEFIALAQSHGYDGAYHQGTGESADDVEYRIFSADQFISHFSYLAELDAEENQTADVDLVAA